MLENANEPYEMLYTYPYEPRIFECWPTRDRKFNNRIQFNKWAEEKHPDRVCPQEFRKKLDLLNVSFVFRIYYIGFVSAASSA